MSLRDDRREQGVTKAQGWVEELGAVLLMRGYLLLPVSASFSGERQSYRYRRRIGGLLGKPSIYVELTKHKRSSSWLVYMWVSPSLEPYSPQKYKLTYEGCVDAVLDKVDELEEQL